MKNKFLIALLMLLIAFQSVAFADFQLGTTVNELVLSGTTDPYKRVTFVLLNSDNMLCDDAEKTIEKYTYNLENDVTMTTSEIFRFSSVNADSEGKWTYTIPMTGLDISGADMESAEYTLNLTLLTNAGDESFIRYSSIAYRQSIIPVLKAKAALDDDCAELTSAITQYIEYITDGSLYKKLTNKKNIAKLNLDVIKGLDASSDASIGILQKSIDESVIVQSVAEGRITSFDTAMSIVDYDTTQKAKITDDGKAEVVAQLKKYKNYSSIDEYKTLAKKQFIIQLFNYNTNQSGTSLLKVLRDNNSILGLNLSELDSLEESDAEYAAKQLAGKKCMTVSEMQTELDGITAPLIETEDEDDENEYSGGGSGGSGGGGGGGSSSSSSSKETLAFGVSAGASISDEYIQQHKYIYSDMEEAAWAADAVVYLAEKGIINGYEDDTFKPLNMITRAEFTKIIVETFFAGEEFEFAGNFSDVSADDWYGEYVNVAYNMGVVSGDGNGSFNPEAPISRQDMAVIIYNAAMKFSLFGDMGDYTEFSDDASISDYAKTAVYCLKNKSVINGVGENLFAPLENADRASAAQIIYSLMTKYNK